jgi:hypothetical protein
MLSSRNRDLIPERAGGGVTLSEVRRTLQEELQREVFLGYQLIVAVYLDERFHHPASRTASGQVEDGGGLDDPSMFWYPAPRVLCDCYMTAK